MSLIYSADITKNAINLSIIEKRFRSITFVKAVRSLLKKADLNIYEELALFLESIGYVADNDILVLVYRRDLSSFRIINTPVNDPKIVGSALDGEIELLTPFDIKDVVYGYNTFKTPKSNSGITAAIAISKKSDFEAELKLIKDAKLDPDHIIAHPMTMLPAKRYNVPVIVIESSRKDLAVASSFENSLLTYHYDSFNGSSAVDITKLLDKISLEIMKIDIFITESKFDIKPSMILLSGEIAEDRSLAEVLSMQTKLPVSMIEQSGKLDIENDRFSLIEATNISSLFSSYSAGFAVARKQVSTQTFIKGHYKKKFRLRGIMTQVLITAWLVISVGLFSFISFSIDSSLLQTEYRYLKKMEKHEFERALGKNVTMVNAEAQLNAKLKSLEEISKSLGLNDVDGDPILARLSDISKAIPRDIKIDLQTLVYDRQKIFLEGTTLSFENINSIRRSLEVIPWSSQVKLTDAKNVPSGDSVKFRFEIDTVI